MHFTSYRDCFTLLLYLFEKWQATKLWHMHRAEEMQILHPIATWTAPNCLLFRIVVATNWTRNTAGLVGMTLEIGCFLTSILKLTKTKEKHSNFPTKGDICSAFTLYKLWRVNYASYYVCNSNENIFNNIYPCITEMTRDNVNPM